MLILIYALTTTPINKQCPHYPPQVKGEVYLVDEPMLSQLDILEDHPTYYRSPQFSFDL